MTTLHLPIINILGASAVRSLALSLLVAAGLRLLRIRNAQLERRAWTGVLLLAIAMPVLVALRIPRISIPALWVTPDIIAVPIHASQPPSIQTQAITAATAQSRTPAVHSRTTTYTSQTFTANTTTAPVSASRGESTASSQASFPVPSDLRGTPYLGPAFPWALFGVMVYTLVTILLLARVLIGLLLARRLWDRADDFPTHEVDCPVRLTAELDSPATLFHGILLPLDAADWDAATLRSTLAHEAAHVQARDFYLQLAASLHFALFWISPLAWWLPAQLSRLSETICDRAAVAITGDGLSYAQLLLRFATPGRSPAGMVAMAEASGLRERVERLIADPQLASAFRHRRGQAAGALFLVGVAAIASAATVRVLAPETAVLAAPQAPAAPSLVPPLPPPAPALAPAAPVAPETPPAVAPAAPAPPNAELVEPIPTLNTVVSDPGVTDSDPAVSVETQVQPLPPMERVAPFDSDGPGYVVYGPRGDDHVMMHGWTTDQEALRGQQARHPGGAIVFERDGKSYVIDDPALVKQAREAYAPVEQLGKQQGELGEKQGALGEQQGQLGEMQGAIGEKQGEWGAHQADFAQNFEFKMPEGFDAAVQKLAESASRLATERDSMDAAQRAELEAQRKAAQADFDRMMRDFKAHQPEREAWEKQMREQTEKMRKQMEPMMKQMGELAAKQHELGRQQAELGRQQALLGQQQRKASHDADQKVQQLIDQALRNGKAHPAP